MGFFSGIGKAIKSVVGAVSDPISSVLDIGKSALGIAAPFMEQGSINSANEANIQQAQAQREWQAKQNQVGMDFSATQAQMNRDFQQNRFYEANVFNQAENREARAFSERMANSTYQRSVQDLRAAGLNPMLAYTQGGSPAPQGSAASSASPPSGSSASGMTSSGASASVRPSFSSQSVASAAQLAQLAANVDNIQADTENKRATAGLIREQTRKTSLEGNTEGYRAGEITARTGLLSAQEKESRDLLLDRADKLRADAQHSRSSAQQIESQRVLMKELMANPWTRDWAPYILDGLKGR